MSKSTDIQINGAELYFLPVKARMPLKFGAETLTHVTCARARIRIVGQDGRTADGWGETPLSVQWVWPSNTPYDERFEALAAFTQRLALTWSIFDLKGHPFEIGHAFIENTLRDEWIAFNQSRNIAMPWLAALVCCSAFDIALHDAYGILHAVPTYTTYNDTYMNADLAAYLTPSAGANTSFKGVYPDAFINAQRPENLPAWHLVGGKDPIDESDLYGSEPKDGYSVLLREWIAHDGLTCLKIKLRGDDAAWDFARFVRVGELALRSGVNHLSADFNCQVTDPAYVNEILDKLRDEYPAIFELILYVEQPFPYELEEHPIDVHSCSERKPLFMDESAHDWKLVRMGRELGWTGVALKTCKTQTGALLSLCWAKAHGMDLMVQDLTNPMLAQIPHVLLAAHAGTIMGVETNAMQFYPEASRPESLVHPGLYQRRKGCINLTSIHGPGFGYRVREIDRQLTAPVVSTI